MTRTQTRRAGPAPCQRRGESLSSSSFWQHEMALELVYWAMGGRAVPRPSPSDQGRAAAAGFSPACALPSSFAAVLAGFSRLTPNLFVPLALLADASPAHTYIYLCFVRTGMVGSEPPRTHPRGYQPSPPTGQGRSDRKSSGRGGWLRTPAEMRRGTIQPQNPPRPPEGLGGQKKKKKKKC